MQQSIVTRFMIKNVSVLCLLSLLMANSYAINMQYLQYSPVASFSSEDFRMLQVTGVKALEENKNGVSSEWQNPKTNNSGTITPLDSSTIKGMPCRKVKINNQTKDKSGHATFTFCQLPDGQWKILK